MRDGGPAVLAVPLLALPVAGPGAPMTVTRAGMKRAAGAALWQRRFAVAAAVLVVLLWELVGALPAADGVFPRFSSTVAQLWHDRDLYRANIPPTLWNAAQGFMFGNVAAITLAVAFTEIPSLGRLFRGVLLSLYCVPLMVIAPIVGVSFGGDVPKVVLASVAVVFPTFISVTVGLAGSDRTLEDVVRGVGGRRAHVLRKVRLRAAVPDLLAGLRVAAPGAVLGAMLGEFLGGRRGLGVLLIATMPQAFPARLWGVGLVATFAAAAGYAVFAAAGRFVETRRRSPLITTAMPVMGAPARGMLPPVWWALSGLCLLGGWVAYLTLTGLPATFAKGPRDVWAYLVTDSASGEHRASMIDAFGSTLPHAALGLACGLGLAFVLATLLSLWPAFASALMPIALVSQSMPLIALTPLVVIALGRGLVAVLAITVSVTFFPGFVAITQGLRSMPSGAVDVLDVYDSSRLQILRKVAVPSAVPHLLAALRLAIPRALLGVIMAEYLALGTGVGGLILRARGRLEFSLLWSIAAVVTALSLVAYSLVGLAERLSERRFGAAS